MASNYKVRHRTVEQSSHGAVIAAVTADEAMLSDQPNVAGPRDRINRRLGDLLFRLGGSLCRRFGLGQERSQLLFGEAQQIKRQVRSLKLPEFRREHLFVPPGVLTDPVVGKDVRALLGFAQMIEHDHRHVLQPKFPRGQQSPVPGDDARVRVHQDRVVEAEFHDARRNLRNLLVRMRAGILGIWHQPLHRPQFNSPRHRRRDASFSHQCRPPSASAARSTASPAPPSSFQSPGIADRRRLAFRDAEPECNRRAAP